MSNLLDMLRCNDAKVAVVGLGYVGLPLALEFVAAGFSVTGVDVDRTVVDELQAGTSRVIDIDRATLKAALDDGRLTVTTDYAALAEMDAISICVPTPLRKTKEPDISHIVASISALAAVVTTQTLIVLESTTYPGTTEELVVPRLSEVGLTVGTDIFVAFSPERIDPGNRLYQTRNTPKIVGGVTPACLEMALALYDGVIDALVEVSSATHAEMVKLLENTFRAVNIALVNEMVVMCHRMKLDFWQIVDAAATKPFGFMPFYPGPGIGGHCIPVDPVFLSWKARAHGYHNRFIELATDINGNMPRWVVDRLMYALDVRGKALSASAILVVGVAYKADVNDTRESPGVELLGLLRERGASAHYHDVYLPTLTLHDDTTLTNTPLTAEALRSFDAAIIATAHTNIEWATLVDHTPLILDTRNALRDFDSENIVKL